MALKKDDMYPLLIAKSDREHTGRMLTLKMHLRDSMDVMRFLLEKWVPERVCAVAGLSEDELKRIALFLAGIHDIGKASNSFQTKILKTMPELRERLREQVELANLSSNEEAFSHHTMVGAAILSDMGMPDWVVSVVGAHHGKPLPENFDPEHLMKSRNYRSCFFARKEDAPLYRLVWREILDDALEYAGYHSAEELPQSMTQPAQMLLVGLLIVADWLSSNTALFPLTDAEDGMADDDLYPERLERAVKKLKFLDRWNTDDSWRYADLGAERFGFDQSNVIQQAITKAAGEAERPGLFILEAPMGAGKTEAALMAGEILANRRGESGLAFFLPSQATANAMFERVMSWVQGFAQEPQSWLGDEEETAGSNGQLTVELAHGKASLNQSFTELSESGALVDEDEAGRIATNAFFMGRKTQLLANFVVGTVDQMLMGALRQKHIMLKHLGLAGKAVVVDEVHAYDRYMSRYMDAMLNWLGAYQTPVILLSATLPGRRRGEMVGAYLGQEAFEGREALEGERAYPLLTWTDGETVCTRRIELDARQTDVEIQRGEEESVIPYLRKRLTEGGCAGVIVNTVKRAQVMAERLKAAFPQYDVLLDHAQLIMPDRIRKEKQIMERVGKSSTSKQRNGLIVVGTQVLEQSLDLDFDVMISDLCPMDLLLQRLGRLHRHHRHDRPSPVKRAACLVLGTRELEPGAKAVYGAYLLRKTAALLPDVMRLPDDISRLVQDTYDSDCMVALSKWAGLYEEYEEYNRKCEKQWENADGACLRDALRDEEDDMQSLNGLLDRDFLYTDEQAQASVRDGVASLEVLVLQVGEDGRIHTAAQDETTLSLASTDAPSREEAKIILRQSIRLPRIFSFSNGTKAIEELEEVRRNTLSEWVRTPSLSRELFLLLDLNGCATLAGIPLRYDQDKGLCVEKEDRDGRNHV